MSKRKLSTKEKVRESQREVGGGTTRSPMGLPNNTRATDRKHSLRSRLWNGCSYPNRNRHAHSPNRRTGPGGRELRTWKTPRLGNWGERKHDHLDGLISAKSYYYYNRKARPRAFKIGTLVLKKVFENTTNEGVGKLQANWEGPYIVSKVGEFGAYHLQRLDETLLLRPWNVSNLKQYYQ